MIISFSRNRCIRGLFRSVLFGLLRERNSINIIESTQQLMDLQVFVYTFFALRRWRIAVTFSRHQFFNSTTHDRAPFVCEGLVACVNCRLRRRFPYTVHVQYFFNRPAGVTFSPAIRCNKKKNRRDLTIFSLFSIPLRVGMSFFFSSFSFYFLF